MIQGKSPTLKKQYTVWVPSSMSLAFETPPKFSLQRIFVSAISGNISAIFRFYTKFIPTCLPKICKSKDWYFALLLAVLYVAPLLQASVFRDGHFSLLPSPHLKCKLSHLLDRNQYCNFDVSENHIWICWFIDSFGPFCYLLHHLQKVSFEVS